MYMLDSQKIKSVVTAELSVAAIVVVVYVVDISVHTSVRFG